MNPGKGNYQSGSDNVTTRKEEEDVPNGTDDHVRVVVIKNRLVRRWTHRLKIQGRGIEKLVEPVPQAIVVGSA